MESNQEMLKMMQQLEKTNRSQARYAKIQCIFTVATAVFCLLLLLTVCLVIPQVRQLAAQINSVAVQAEVVLTNLESVTSELAEADLAGMVSNLDSLVVSSQSGVEQALEKINAIDIDALNQAIKNLSDVIAPLVKFIKSFS